MGYMGSDYDIPKAIFYLKGDYTVTKKIREDSWE